MLLRREFLKKSSLAAVAGMIPWSISCTGEAQSQDNTTKSRAGTWEAIREDFLLDPDYIHMAGLLISSHPTQV